MPQDPSEYFQADHDELVEIMKGPGRPWICYLLGRTDLEGWLTSTIDDGEPHFILHSPGGNCPELQAHRAWEYLDRWHAILLSFHWHWCPICFEGIPL